MATKADQPLMQFAQKQDPTENMVQGTTSFGSDLANWRQQQQQKDALLGTYQQNAQSAQQQADSLKGRIGQVGQDYDKQLNSGLANMRRAALARIQGGLGALGAGQGAGGLAMGNAAKEFGNQTADFTTQQSVARNQAVNQAQEAYNQSQATANAANTAYQEQALKRGTEMQDIQDARNTAEQMVVSAINSSNHWYGLDRSDAAGKLRQLAASETNPYIKKYLLDQAHAIVTEQRSN